jgi:hypothetical protein
MFAEVLMQVLDAAKGFANMIPDFAEGAALRARFTAEVGSEAEVDAAAAEWGIAPERPCAGHYRVVNRMGPVTATVAFVSDGSAPATAAAIAGVCNWAAGEVHGERA